MRPQENNHFSFSKSEDQLRRNNWMDFSWSSLNSQNLSEQFKKIKNLGTIQNLNVSQPLDFTFVKMSQIDKKHKIKKTKEHCQNENRVSSRKVIQFYQNLQMLQAEESEVNPAKNQNHFLLKTCQESNVSFKKDQALFSFYDENTNKDFVNKMPVFSSLCKSPQREFVTPVQKKEFKFKARDKNLPQKKCIELNPFIQFDFDPNANKQQKLLDSLSPVFEFQNREQKQYLVQDSFLDITPDFLNRSNCSVREKVAALKKEAIKYANNPNQYKGELMNLSFAR